MNRTIEEYKKDVFDELDDDKKLEWMYQMSKQLCNISKIIRESKGMDFQKLEEILKVLGEYER